MINITYDRSINLTRVEANNLQLIKEHLPLKVQFKNIVTGEIHYESELLDYWWTELAREDLIKFEQALVNALGPSANEVNVIKAKIGEPIKI